MARIIIDGTDGTRGRIASFAAKNALAGTEIVIVNSEKVLVSGNPVMNIMDFKKQRALNTIKPTKGPFFSRSPEKMLKRAIRGMLPDYRRARGKDAWRLIKCYAGLPEEFKNEKLIKIEGKKPKRVMTLEQLGRDV